MNKIKRIWVDESFAIKLKKEAVNRNKSILEITKEICNDKDDFDLPKKINRFKLRL